MLLLVMPLKRAPLLIFATLIHFLTDVIGQNILSSLGNITLKSPTRS